MFEKILEKLVSYKQLPSGEADAAKLEFSNFLSTTVKEKKDSFVKFDKETDRVDTFIWQFFLDTNKFIVMKGAQNVDDIVPWSTYCWKGI